MERHPQTFPTYLHCISLVMSCSSITYLSLVTSQSVHSGRQVMVDCQDLHLDDASIAYSPVFAQHWLCLQVRSSFRACVVISRLHTFAPYIILT